MTRNSACKPASAAGDEADEAAVDLSILQNTVGFMIRIVQLQIFQAFYDQFSDRGLTTGIYSALTAIHANPGIKQGTLAAAMLVKRSNMTKLISHMSERGLVERRVSAVDKRSIDLYLTSQGKQVLAGVVDDALAHDRKVTAGLTPDERRTFVHLLNKLSADLSVGRRARS